MPVLGSMGKLGVQSLSLMYIIELKFSAAVIFWGVIGTYQFSFVVTRSQDSRKVHLE